MERAVQCCEPGDWGAADMNNDVAVNGDLPPCNSGSNIEKQIEEELRFHLANLADEIQETNGSSRVDAEEHALQQFGDLEGIFRTCLKLAWKERMMEKLTTPVFAISILAAAVIVVALFFSAQSRKQMALEARYQAMKAEKIATIAHKQAEEAEARQEETVKLLVDAIQGAEPERENQIDVRAILESASQKIVDEFADQPEVVEKLKTLIEQAKNDIKNSD